MKQVSTAASAGDNAVSVLTPAELEALVAEALDAARDLGVDQAEVAASHDVGLSVTARLGEVENLEYTNDRGVWVTVYEKQRKGSASTSDTSSAAIREAVAKAHSFARYTAADPHAGLADAERMCRDIIDLDLDHPWDIDAERAIDMAIRCEAAGLAVDDRINNSEGATVSTNRGSRAYGNTHGFVGSVRKSSHSVTCVLLGADNGAMQRDYYYSAARNAAELDDVEVVGREAGRRTVARLGARKISTARVPVLFTPELARGFIGHAIGAITGSAQYRRASFLLDAVGETLFPSFVTIEERPHIPRGMASAAYDAEGVQTCDRDIVRDGILRGYILSSYSARRLGLETTANAGGPQNLIVSSNATDLDELVASMGTGLLVEELIGHGVNPVTGDYSRGAVGHWVENGEIRYPVHEVTIAGNLRELYKRIESIGADRDLRSGIRCGSLLVGEMTVAGN
ncbi:MAG: metalloprotease PmbA [Woeseiaceae bacterium]|nr:metalloprotease PmbA [Woeseiaceae bacterium]